MSHIKEAPIQTTGADETGTDWQAIPTHKGSAAFRRTTEEIRIIAPDRNLIPTLVNDLAGIREDGAIDPIGKNSRTTRIETPQPSQLTPVIDIFVARDPHS